MQQVATFAVPVKQQECNEFLAKNKPSQISFRDGQVVVFYDDGRYPPAYEVIDLCEHLDSVRKARFQQEVALHVAKSEAADLNPKHNKGRFEELDNAIREIQKAIDIQGVKEDFLVQRIKGLRP
jgi:hypothetical protein